MKRVEGQYNLYLINIIYKRKQISTVDEIDNHADYFKDHDFFFSCFGTTRADAGGAVFIYVII